MSERVFFITGTSRGIGAHLAAHFAARGERVLGCSRTSPGPELPNYTHYTLDIGDEAAVVQLFRELRRQHDSLDVLINNAGIAAMNHTLLTPLRSLERLFRTNVGGTFLCCREAARLMRKPRGGRILNLSTIAVPLSLEGEAAYVATKAAVEALTRVLSKELADLGITVNALGPTAIDTDLTRSVPKAKLDELLRRQAIRRMGTFEDVTHAVEFFVSPQSDFVTGQVLYLGGVI